MLLNKLKTTWTFYKQQSDLSSLSEQDILMMIQSQTAHYQRDKQFLLINTAMLLLIVLCCQGG